MSMFGDPSRKVNLGRRPKQAKDVVDASKKAREEREWQRRREQYTRRIQANFRARKQLALARAEQSALWALNKSSSIVDHPSTATLLLATRQFLLLSNSFVAARAPAPAVLPQFFQLLRALDASLQVSYSSHKDLNFVTTIFEAATAKSSPWPALLRLLCQVCLAHLSAASASSADTSNFSELPLAFLKSITSSKSYNQFNAAPQVESLVNGIVRALVDKGAIDKLAKALDVNLQATLPTQIVRQARDVAVLASDWLGRYFASTVPQSSPAKLISFKTMCNQFVRSILARPVLTVAWRRSPSSPGLGTASKPEASLSTISDVALIALKHSSDVAYTSTLNSADLSELESAFVLMDNLSALLSLQTNNELTRLIHLFEVTAQLANKLDSVIWQKRKKLMDYLKTTADVDMACSDDDEEPAAAPSPASAAAAAVVSAAQAKIQEEEENKWNQYLARLQSAVEILLAPSTIKVLATTISKASSPDQSSSQAVNNLARLLRAKASGDLSGDALSSLYLVLADVLMPMWPTIRGIITGQTPNAATASTPGTALENALPLIGLFANCYAHLLQDVLDDVDFYEKQAPLALKDVTEVVVLFKAIALRRMQYGAATSQQEQQQGPFGRLPAANSQQTTATNVEVLVEWDSTLNAINALLAQLFRRNQRRQFTNPTNFFAMQLRAEEMMHVMPWRHPIIAHCPSIIPTNEKVKLFHHWIDQDKQNHQSDAPGQAVHVSIRRNDLFRDAYNKMNTLRSGLKQQIKVEFISKDGITEPGIDGGGLFRELLTEYGLYFVYGVIKEGFSPEFGLFIPTPENTLYPNPKSAVFVDNHLSRYEFLGRVLGKCVYEFLLVDLPLAPFFIAHLLQRKNRVADLKFLDEEMLRNLMQLKNFHGNVEDMGVSFTTTRNALDSAETVELVPGGENIVVTNDTRQKYISMVAEDKLNKQIQAQSTAFLKGFCDLIDPRWVTIFTEEEFALNIGGLGGRLNIQDLMNNCRYTGGFNENHETILLLWEVLNEMTDEEQHQFLKFCTSHSRPPILGFHTLNPKFCLHCNGYDDKHLPSSNTCMHLLKFPAYKSKEQLKQKFLYAIKSGAGFELS